jgi:hypothetical protein
MAAARTLQDVQQEANDVLDSVFANACQMLFGRSHDGVVCVTGC